MSRELKMAVVSGTLMLIWGGILFARGPDTLWTRTYGGAANDQAYCVQQTSDGGYVVVGLSYSSAAGESDVYLIKTDLNGNVLWIGIYGGTGADCGYAVRQTSDGGYIIAGYTDSFGAGDYDVYLIKTDPNGDTSWTKTYGGPHDDCGYSIQETLDSGYVVVGYTDAESLGLYYNRDVYLLKINGEGDTIWTRRIYADTEFYDEGYSVQQTSDGGYIITGTSGPLSTGVYLVKTGANGDILWTQGFGEQYSACGCSVQETADSGYIVAGYMYTALNMTDVYLIKTNENGDAIWEKIHGGADFDVGYSIQQTADSGYVIAGYTWSFGAGKADVYLIKIDADGDILWTMTCGGTDSEEGRSVRQTSDSGYIITGYTNSFGAGNYDVYLIKTGPETAIQEIHSPRRALFISQSRPNPFDVRTFIEYELPQSSNVHITIYSLPGREVRTLADNNQTAGLHTVTWDGTDDAGRKVPSGTYFVRLAIRPAREGHTGLGTHAGFAAGGYNATRKVCVVR